MARLSPLNLAENAWADGREDGQNFGLGSGAKKEKSVSRFTIVLERLTVGVSARPVALL